MKVLFVGDVVGVPGRRAVAVLIPRLREQHGVDVVVVNGENATNGVGINAKHVRELFRSPIDVMTLGNHTYRHRDVWPVLDADARIVRPANMVSSGPGRGLTFVNTPDGEVAVINLMGSLYLQVARSPFEVARELVERARARTNVVLVDMHAEATSEKVGMGLHLDGLVSAVVGTHTHVQTSDARLLPGGTAYVTDLGMTGPHDGVIGARGDIIVRRFVTGLPEKMEPARGDAKLEGALVDLDAGTGRARSITLVREDLDEA